MNTVVKPQELSIEAQNLFIELVNINLRGYKKVNYNMLANAVFFYSYYTPFNNVSFNYLLTLCNNKGIKINS